MQVDLREYLEAVLNRKVQIRSYAGFRHWINMPVHGQRTHSNNGTQRRLGKMRKFVRPEQFFVVEQSSRDWRMRNRKRVLSKSERNRVVLMEKQKQRAQLRLKKRLKRIGKKKRS
mgnify:FL=1